MTTFKSIKTDDGVSVISSEHKKVVEAEEGVLIEEVLSDIESTADQRETPSYKVEIIEVGDITGEFLQIYYNFFLYRCRSLQHNVFVLFVSKGNT